MGWHAVGIVGWSEEEALKLLDELDAFATQPKYVYSHKWRPRDLVIWDTAARCTARHHSERYRYKRDLRRTTINEYGPEAPGTESMRAGG